MMKECGKESIPYKMEAINSIAPILETHKLNRFTDINNILTPLLDKVGSQNLAISKRQQFSNY